MENGKDFVTGAHPGSGRKWPEKQALGRRLWCSRVELLRARQSVPPPPKAPPWSPGPFGRSPSRCRGRNRRTRSPEFLGQGCALRVCLLRSRRGTAPPPNSPPSSSGSISGSLQLRRGRKRRERIPSPPLLLAGTRTPGLSPRSTHRWKEEVEVVRKRAAPPSNSAGNVAGKLVNFRPKKSRFVLAR